MNEDLLTVDLWDLPSLDLADVSQLPHEPGIYAAYLNRRILYIAAALSDIRNSWFRQKLSQHFQDLGPVKVAYQVISQVSPSELETLRKRLIVTYDPQYNGKSQQVVKEYRAVIQQLKSENRSLKAVLKKERAAHQMALCQLKIHLVSQLLTELETSLEEAKHLEDWMGKDHTQRSLGAVVATLGDISGVLAVFHLSETEPKSQ
ncbi:hypothetical protein C7293_04960 [filamentous cyanobacterium CCT1]|nr:hypothetical protein C7293_04960 [filamentous cyanobacterium CCT1]PSN81050.1 hypothetical protein C8B47_03305 [filamentous cyanobacterium CCP4]